MSEQMPPRPASGLELTPVGPELEELRDLVDETFGVFETQYRYRQSLHTWTLDVRLNSFEWYAVFRDRNRWVDEDGGLGSEEDDSPSSGSAERALVMIAYRVGLGVLEEWRDGDLPGQYKEWFIASSQYLTSVGERENPADDLEVMVLKGQANALWTAIRYNVMQKPDASGS